MDAVKDSVSPRLLTLVVAYNAASTLKGVLERIPDTITGTDCRVLIIDDASLDQTFEVGMLESQLNDRVEILVNLKRNVSSRDDEKPFHSSHFPMMLRTTVVSARSVEFWGFKNSFETAYSGPAGGFSACRVVGCNG